MNGAELIWKQGDRTMNAWGRTIDAWCDVRSLANGRRGKCEVVYSVWVRPDGSHAMGIPYDPIIMPAGLWQIGQPKRSTDPETRPWFVPVGCAPVIEEWSVIQRGDGALCYDEPTGRHYPDAGYAIHSGDITIAEGRTLGCLYVPSEDEMARIADYQLQEIKRDRDTFLRVLPA